MEAAMVALFGSVGTVAFFACIGFSVWVDYKKKKDERDAAHQQQMKALELGYPPSDAEVERARAISSAAWAAGLIGLLVPLVIVSLTFAGTLVTILTIRHGSDGVLVGLIVSWSIAGVVTLVIALRSLGVISNLPQPTGESARRQATNGRLPAPSSNQFRGERSEA